MNELVLTACDESRFPISAMAALGTLRVLTHLMRDQGIDASAPADEPRLSWLSEPRWTAVLHTGLSRADVLRALTGAAARATQARVWTTQSDPKRLTPQAYRELLQAGDIEQEEETLTALACEWPLTKWGKLMLTPFLMTSGRQQWCASICAAAQLGTRPKSGSTNTSIDALEEALFGRWRYTDELSALGWDPATERQHALEAKAPTKSSPKSVAAAVWLAAESLGLFPCCSVGGSLHTTCFDDAGQVFFWPVWRSPLTYYAVRATLRLPLAQARQGPDRSTTAAFRQELMARGIDGVFASRRMPSAAGHGYYVFWPAELLWSR